MIEFRLLSEEEVAAENARWEIEDAAEVERQRVRDACVAEHGSHDWELELEDPDGDERGSFSLRCTRCPAGVDDVYPDGQEMIWCEVDGEEMVRDGWHYSSVPLVVPVDVDLWTGSHWTDYGMEYDVELNITQRGPTRPLGGQDGTP